MGRVSKTTINGKTIVVRKLDTVQPEIYGIGIDGDMGVFRYGRGEAARAFFRIANNVRAGRPAYEKIAS